MMFPHTVTLLSRKRVQGDFGGIQFEFPGPGVPLAAFVQHRTEAPAEINQTGGVRTGVVIYVRGDAGAVPLDRVVYDGKTYEVVAALPQRNTTFIHHTKLQVIELDQVER